MAKKQSRKTVKQPESAIQPRMLTVKGAADYLASSVWFVRNLVWNQKLLYLKFGSKLVFDRADLDAFIEQEKRAAQH